MIDVDFTGRKFPEIVLRITGRVINGTQLRQRGILMQDFASLAMGTIVFEYITCIFKLASICSKLQVRNLTGEIKSIIPIFNIAREIGGFCCPVVGDGIGTDLLAVTWDLGITLPY